MINNCLGIIVTLMFVVLHPSVLAQTNFPHPCVEYNLADLQRMKTNQNVDPWRIGFAAFASQGTASTNYVMQGPFTSVTRNNTGWRLETKTKNRTTMKVV